MIAPLVVEHRKHRQALDDVLYDCPVLGILGSVDHIGLVDPSDRPVGGYLDYPHAVDSA